jgi:hypothetical protein
MNNPKRYKAYRHPDFKGFGPEHFTPFTESPTFLLDIHNLDLEDSEETISFRQSLRDRYLARQAKK